LQQVPIEMAGMMAGHNVIDAISIGQSFG